MKLKIDDRIFLQWLNKNNWKHVEGSSLDNPKWTNGKITIDSDTLYNVLIDMQNKTYITDKEKDEDTEGSS